MNKVVVDTSVAVKWFVAEQHSVAARRILDQYQDGTVSFLAPDLLVAEFYNVIGKKHSRGILSENDARSILTAFRLLNFTLLPAVDLLEDAFKIATTHRRSVYDSLFIALSTRENCQCVTADEKVINAVGPAFPNLVWLPSWS
ncbi:MAG TPA: type II toxin-antitoxin system VapC family toxin [Pyrinomonadaceae bacterium]|jgi:predicted nucleic acid-binding protein